MEGWIKEEEGKWYAEAGGKRLGPFTEKPTLVSQWVGYENAARTCYARYEAGENAFLLIGGCGYETIEMVSEPAA